MSLLLPTSQSHARSLPCELWQIGVGCYGNEIDINYLLKGSICGPLTLTEWQLKAAYKSKNNNFRDYNTDALHSPSISFSRLLSLLQHFDDEFNDLKKTPITFTRCIDEN